MTFEPKSEGVSDGFWRVKNIDYPFLQTPVLMGQRIIFFEVSFMYNPEAGCWGHLIE